MLTDAGAEWLETRGLDVETAVRMGVESRRPRNAHGGEWLAIPHSVDGTPVNWSYRWLDAPPDESGWSQDKGKQRTWFNGDVIADPGLQDQPLIITEGQWDAIALVGAGLQRTVSIVGGAPEEPLGPDAEKYAYIDLGKFRHVQQIILAVDADSKGAALRTDLVSIFGAARCRWVEWSAHCKDANDVLVRGGADAMRKCIDRARWCVAPGLRQLSDYPPSDGSAPTVWRAPVTPAFERNVGFLPGFHSVTTGIPTHGKSTLMNIVQWEFARQGIGGGAGSFEAPPNAQYLRDCGKYLLGRPPEGSGARGPWTTEERDRLHAWVEENISFLDPHELGAEEGVTPTLTWFLDTAAAANIRYGRRFFVLDPWSDISQERRNGQTEGEFIQQTQTDLKRFCRRFNVHVNVVAHPKKIEAEGTGKKRQFKRPTLYDISGSAHWYNGTTLGLVVHKTPRKDMDGNPVPNCTRTMIGVDKIKWADFQGKAGDIEAQFYPASGRFGPA